MDEFDTRVAVLCATAFACGCRVAISGPSPRMIPTARGRHGLVDTRVEMDFEFVMLSPGERPPATHQVWTIYECRDGMAVGGSACT